jgi:hypothetical protein
MNLSRTAHLSFLTLWAAAVAACLPGSKSIGAGESGTDGDSGMASTSGTDADPSATSSPTTATSTTTPPDDTGSVTSGTTGVPETTGDTGIVDVCDIEIEACTLAEQSKSPPVDCGVVDPLDPDEDWIAMRQCILDAVDQTLPFKAVYEREGIDSTPRSALLAVAGESYQLMALFQDSGGFVGVTGPVTSIFCGEITEIGDCLPGAGELCLECLGDDGGQLCP